MEMQNGQLNKSPINVMKFTLNNSIAFFPTVCREELTLLKIEDNSATAYIDGDSIIADNGDFVIIRPFALHSIRPAVKTNPVAVIAVTVNLRAFNYGRFSALTQFFHEKNVPFLIQPTDDCYKKINDSFTILLSGEKTTQDETAYSILQTLYENRLPIQQHDMTDEKQRFAMKKVIGYISCNFSKSVTIDELMQESGYSEYYLMKLFKRFTGMSCIDYVNGFRIAQAQRLLIETNLDVNEIAREVGYTNISYFNRQFKRWTSATPLVMRLTMRK